MAKAFLHNIEVAEEEDASSSTKWKMVTTSQMWGSGKSWLGHKFLQAIEQYADKLPKKGKKYFFSFLELILPLILEGIDALSTLKCLTHLHVWLPKPFLKSTCISVAERDATFKQLFARCIIDELHLGKELAKQPLHRYDCGDIIRSLTDRPLLVHIDDVDTWMNTTPMSPKESSYHLWKTHLLPILRAGSQVYCSGLSCYLYELNLQLYQSQQVSNWPQECPVEFVLLDTLRPSHLEEILRKLRTIFREEAIGQATEAIYDATGGVPRLVAFTLTYLEELRRPLFDTNSLHELLGSKLVFWIEPKRTTVELSPYEALKPLERKLYFDCMIVAALGLPLSIDTLLTIPALSSTR